MVTYLSSRIALSVSNQAIHSHILCNRHLSKLYLQTQITLVKQNVSSTVINVITAPLKIRHMFYVYSLVQNNNFSGAVIALEYCTYIEYLPPGVVIR